MNDISGSDIDDLSAYLKQEHIVYITGAGISIASGIPAYRSGPDAIWDKNIQGQLTTYQFNSNPSEWYKFWQTSHATLLSAVHQPNEAHIAIAKLLKSSDIVITQNIDRLHTAAGIADEQVIHIHGRHDHYVCSSKQYSDKRKECSYRKLPMTAQDVVDQVSWKCPNHNICRGFIRPLILMFDESYTSHSAYKVSEAIKKIKQASCLVFIGTSFSVGFTSMAIDTAKKKGKKILNINLSPQDKMINFIGKAEEILPQALLPRNKNV